MTNNIRSIREKLDMSQAKLAELAATSQPQIDRLEKRDPRNLKQGWIVRIARALSVDEAEIIGFETQDGDQAAPISAEDIAMRISIACSAVLGDLLRSKKIADEKEAERAIEKAVRFYWDDFRRDTPPTNEQIRKFIMCSK